MPRIRRCSEVPFVHSGLTWSTLQLYSVYGAIIVLIVLNLRGVKESVQILMPIFLLFLLTHVLLIVGAIVLHLPAIGERGRRTKTSEFTAGYARSPTRLAGHARPAAARLFAGRRHVHRLGGRLEQHAGACASRAWPRRKRTMRYMAFSLAFTAGGLIVAYLLLGINHSGDKR